jgi:hypothetical protein
MLPAPAIGAKTNTQKQAKAVPTTATSERGVQE